MRISDWSSDVCSSDLTFLACIFHQSGKSMAPLRRCHAFQPIALHIPAAAIILCLHGVEIQAHEGKRNNHEHANDTPGRQAAISHVSAQATYPKIGRAQV